VAAGDDVPQKDRRRRALSADGLAVKTRSRGLARLGQDGHVARVLVLGGTYFIGRAVVHALAREHEVTVLNRGTRNPPAGAVAQLRADRMDAGSVRRALASRGGVDAVVDVSGIAPAHIRSTAPVLRELGVERYVYVSSAAVYDGATTSRPFPEDAPAPGEATWGDYARAKALCEQALHAHGFAELTVLRPPYVYGPFNTEPREQFLWARMLAGRPVLVPGDGTTPIQFCPVDHVADVVAAACRGELAPATYNVAESRSYTLTDYVDVLAAAAGVAVPEVRLVPGSVPARDFFPFRDYELVVDTSRLEAATPLRPRDLAVGLAATYLWFRDNAGFPYAPMPREVELLALGIGGVQ
jgi:nucleoside-diphosphate-sugar epimerase